MKENMLQEDGNYVALFIDWDNLAISTSVDFGGAVPDVRAIVHAAQRFGTVVLARAYAEWNVNSDRLSVYRAGVEPVYAPIFRFEPEPGTGMPRGKSLADPCMVTDSIDAMHLMSNINVFVLVSGDKDLIPVVRLAQLRGKKVVVIGPDFVAAVLREMADEYIPYRGLVEAGEATAVPEVAAPARSGRRLHGGGRSSQLPAGPAPRPSNPTAPTPPPAGRNGATTPKAPPAEAGVAEPPVAPGAPAPAPVAPVSAAASAEPEVAPEEVQEVGPLFETIRTILREREETGKPRLRATNLKDQLIARIPGFNERRYGFPRFKDVLAAAEKAGVLNVSRTGPVQWVTLATPPSGAAPAPASSPAASAPPAPPPAEPPSAPTSPATPEAEAVADLDIIRFILDLRDRSRWLTYTYVLTNLLNHLGNGAADAAADTAARAALNHLVQSGVLVVDREPREIDVNGTRHRVRLCHVVEEHPLVQQLTAETAEAVGALPAPAETSAAAPPSEAASEPAPTPAGVTAETEPEVPESAIEPVAVVIESGAPDEAVPIAVQSTAVAEAPSAADAAGEVPIDEAGDEPVQTVVELPAASAESPVAAREDSASAEPAPVVSSPAGAAAAEENAAAEPEAPAAEASPEQSRETGDRPNGQEDEVRPRGQENGVRASLEENGVLPKAPLTLAQSYDILREVVREATGPNRPSTGPAAVKNRLVRRLGAFDERSFGFSKFKDYLLAAEKAGAVKVEVSGTTARVSLPPEG
jgi:hypothetical protein